MRWLNTPHDLYISAEFRQLRAQLMHERVNAEGVLICAHCGKPILRDFECIAHHITEVTAANLNNAEITLNPANILLVHLQCHNAIHERFGYAYKKVYYIWGAPCCGKNTFVQQAKGRNDLVIDVDALWVAVTGGEKYFKPDSLKQNVFMLRDCLLEQVKTRAGKWNTAYILSTEPRSSARNRVCAAIGAEPIYIPVDRETALQRLHDDKERGPYVAAWEGYINRFFDDLEVG